MATRLISAAVAIVILLAVVLSGSMTALSIALTICALLGICELYKAFGFIKKPVILISGMVMTVLIMQSRFVDYNIILAAFFVYAVIMACCMLGSHKEFCFSDMATAVFCIFYVPVSLLTLYNVRCEEHGFYLLWIALGGAWVTDSFAYFCGRLFGKHKLCPNISPKKTIEGSVGGSFFTVVIGIVFGYCINRFAGVEVNYIALAVLCLICAAVSQIGDLTASIIKREKGIKDFGNIMPGHGGFMDRFDSTLFVAPAVYVFNLIFTIFG